MTDKKLKDDEPVNEQLAKQLLRLVVASHKSGRNFYGNGYNSNSYGNDYEE
ncbi:MAG: hypothetical protein IPP48_01550 [Chitinophagaceae bacterium]|nr:hypothetical protein [Chitinophagaceae bacterium]